jgi:hypothetical protein
MRAAAQASASVPYRCGITAKGRPLTLVQRAPLARTP